MSHSFFDHLQENLGRQPDLLAFQLISRQGRELFSYRRVAEEVAKLSVFFSREGIHRGSTVGILMENHPRWGIAFLAAQSAGARIVPFDILHSDETLACLIQHSECGFLVASESFRPRLEAIQDRLPRRLPALINGAGGDSAYAWHEVLDQVVGTPHLPLEQNEPDDPLLILYTSGTTGDPKGVVLSRQSVDKMVQTVTKAVEISSRDHILSVLPLYHILALMANFIIPLFVGARVTYLDSLDGQRILETFRAEGITIFVCVPQFYNLMQRRILTQLESQSGMRRFLFNCLLAISRRCNRHLGRSPGRFFFRRLHRRFGDSFRFFAVGGARFDPEVARFLWDLGLPIIQAYGMTETTAVATLTPFSFRAAGSAGKPLPGVEVDVDNPDELGVGEIIVRGSNLMQGYWKNSAATEEVLSNGWMHTGDLGYLDENGYLHITGRKKDVIVLSSGKNVFPEEVEHLYQSQCPFIKEICVLGIEDDTAGEGQEKLHAVVVPDFDYMKSQQVANAYEMIRYMMETISQSLPPYKRVHSVEIRRQPLPRTTTRKIKRFEVRAELQSVPARSAPAEEEARPLTATERTVFAIVKQMRKVAGLHAGMNLELDIGFDSLARVEFLSSVQEAFGVDISDDEAAQILTVEEVVQAVEERLSAGDVGPRESRQSWTEILQQPLEEEERRKVEQILSKGFISNLAFYLITKFVLLSSKLLFGFKARGNLDFSEDYPYLICPNHLSYFDAFLLVGPLPWRVLNRIFFLGYADYFSGPITSLWGRFLKVIPVDADRHLKRALRLGAEGLRRGMILAVFPEGERSIDGELKLFRKGPAILATELKLPIIPVAIVGTYEVWPRGVSRIRLRPVSMRFGDPLLAARNGAHVDEVNGRLSAAVGRLIEEERSLRADRT